MSAEFKEENSTIVRDEFEQRYYLRVSERGGGTLIQLDGTANAFLTSAVRRAAEDLARRLSPSGDAALF